MKRKPIIGITMGDPAGCGPEITIKAFQKQALYQWCRPLVIADAKVLENAIRILQDTNLAIRKINSVDQALFTFGTIDVFHLDSIEMNHFQLGVVDASCGKAAFLCVEKAIELALDNKIDATVTNALNKEALNLAGYHYSGHTEIFAEKTHVDRYSMMLVHEKLRVVHVSTHVSLIHACRLVEKDRVLHTIELAHATCLGLGLDEPRIGVAGLNPHAGENGLFGDEEINEIAPAIEEARQKGINAVGPFPADTIFSKALAGWYDVVVAMYHDQGHIPLKIVGFSYDTDTQNWTAVKGVNITLGLPIIRTSVDHGTAFDLAGTGTASEASLVDAITFASELAKRRGLRHE